MGKQNIKILHQMNETAAKEEAEILEDEIKTVSVDAKELFSKNTSKSRICIAE